MADTCASSQNIDGNFSHNSNIGRLIHSVFLAAWLHSNFQRCEHRSQDPPRRSVYVVRWQSRSTRTPVRVFGAAVSFIGNVAAVDFCQPQYRYPRISLDCWPVLGRFISLRFHDSRRDVTGGYFDVHCKQDFRRLLCFVLGTRAGGCSRSCVGPILHRVLHRLHSDDLDDFEQEGSARS